MSSEIIKYLETNEALFNLFKLLEVFFNEKYDKKMHFKEFAKIVENKSKELQSQGVSQMPSIKEIVDSAMLERVQTMLRLSEIEAQANAELNEKMKKAFNE